MAEALASDLPVLCTKNAGSEVLIEDDYNGYKFNINDNIDIYLEKIILNLNKLKENTFNSISNKTLENKIYEYIKSFNKVINE